jgi:hypothetical protein
MNSNLAQSTVNDPPSITSDVAVAAFVLLEKLDPGPRLPPPSISKVFRLYCIEGLSAAQVADRCGCSKAAIIRRLNLIRHKTGLSPRLLRKHTNLALP